MTQFEGLRERIAQQLAKAAEEREAARRHLGLRMEEVNEFARRFNEVAGHWTQAVVRPRMEILVEQLGNAEMAPSAPGRPFQTACRFRHTEELLGPGVFEVSINGDARRPETVALNSHLQVFSVSWRTRDHRVREFEIATSDRSVGQWVDERILDCVKVIVRLEQADESRAENLVRDPVCGMQFPRAHAAGETQFEGETYYFCTDYCRGQFADNPTKFSREI